MTEQQLQEGLFACSKCHGRFAFEELSRSEHLCKDCRHAHPMASCIHCRMEFHLLKKKDKNPVCLKCDSSLAIHGQPKCCQYCNLRAAFGGPHCNRCKSSEKKYGPPVSCEQCKLNSAFKKPDDVLKKVDGKLLCLLCTMSYKRLQHRHKKASKRKHTDTSSSKHKNGAKEAKSSKTEERNTPVADNPLKQFYTSHSSDNASDQLASDHVTELTKLREELAGMKRQLQQKEQMLIEKEKRLTELKAENWEKQKELRQKITSIQKDNSEKLQLLQNENQNMKKKISQLSKSSTTKASNNS